MQEEDTSADEIPVLTDMVEASTSARDGLPNDVEALIAELQTELAASTFALTEHLLQNALTEMESALFAQVSARLRQELPELVDGVLRKHLGQDDDS